MCCDCQTYSFTLSTIAGAGDCTNLNRTHLITKIPGLSCSWTGSNGGINSSLTANVATLPPCGVYRLQIGPILVPAASATYIRNVVDWDCSSDGACNTMTLETFTGCTGWPATLDVCCAD